MGRESGGGAPVWESPERFPSAEADRAIRAETNADVEARLHRRALRRGRAAANRAEVGVRRISQNVKPGFPVQAVSFASAAEI